MKCELCGSKMVIAESRFFSEKGSEEVYNELKMVCINPKCDDFAGHDLNKTTKFKTIRRKVN